jgi:hypothetical protein
MKKKELTQNAITKDSVVQVNENGPKEWIGCLMQVSEPKEWGVLAWVRIPHSGNAYLRLPFDQIDHIGEAVMKLKEQEDDEER